MTTNILNNPADASVIIGKSKLKLNKFIHHALDRIKSKVEVDLPALKWSMLTEDEINTITYLLTKFKYQFIYTDVALRVDSSIVESGMYLGLSKDSNTIIVLSKGHPILKDK